MQHREYWGYQVELDEKATADWYTRSTGWGCKCGDCRNFLALAKKRAFLAPIVEALDSLGIPLEKATYVGELFKDEAGVHYQFSYRLAGTILAVPEQETVFDLSKGRCCHDPYPYGAPNFPEPHFDLEFGAVLPWVLDEDPHGKKEEG